MHGSGTCIACSRSSDDHYHRVRTTARELTAPRIRECRHDDDLARCEGMLVEARGGWLYGLDQAFTRAELVEVRNWRHLLAMGRTAPKAKGPRFDPALLPIEALERLIQTHPDVVLVEKLQAERYHRFSQR